MKSIYICTHLGLGDLLICNGLIRHYAALYDHVMVPCKHTNSISSLWLFKDEPKIIAHPVSDEADALFFAKNVWGHTTLKLGYFNPPFDRWTFDQEFYRQAGVSFDYRWTGFKYPTPNQNLRNTFPGNPSFVHMDRTRGMEIKPSLLPPIFIEPGAGSTPNIFDYVPILQAAPEIHCINSSFAILVDSIELPQNPKLVLHEYARQGETPTFRKDWIRLK